MLRGCQKQMIVLQTPESPVFESAFFVLRREPGDAGQNDMMAEANRIVGNGSYLRKRSRLPRWMAPFLSGVVVGGGVFSLIYLLCLL